MIEQKTLYYCDDCGDRINTAIEPEMYLFKQMRVSVMLCLECKENLRKNLVIRKT